MSSPIPPASPPPPDAARPRILSVANQKGGVGKTTTTINLGTALAAIGERVLIIDLDPQGNASTGLGLGHEDRGKTSYDVLTGQAGLAETIRETLVPGLEISTSDINLSGAELELANDRIRNFRLKRAIDAYLKMGGRHSYILIDCPPSLGLLTMSAMTASDAVIVPLQAEFFALEGLSQLLRTVELVRVNLNPRLEIQGVVLTMFDKRNNLSGQVASDVRAHLGDKVYKTVIPRNVRISEAPSHGKPALLYDHKCAGSQAYIRLASEIIQRERARKKAA
ncbi:MAG: ParA family protein [Parvularculaceae bacterium]